MLEKLQKSNNNYVIYAPDSLKYITDSISIILDKSIELYKKIFDIENFRKIQINYFDDINKFREYIYNLRGESKSLPEYAQGTFDNGMINSFISSNIIIGTPLYNNKLYMASHELFHIMYKELIWKDKYNRIVWFDEGMAQFFSGENDFINERESFEKWFKELKEKTVIIPSLNELKHGSTFETREYSGYSLSLLAVKYLYDSLKIIEFKKLMHNPDKILMLGTTVVQEAFGFYDNIFIQTK